MIFTPSEDNNKKQQENVKHILTECEMEEWYAKAQ